MANWCDNTLGVTGPDEDMARFKEKAVGVYPGEETQEQQALNFHSLLPVPAEVLAAGEEVREAWEERNWGCRYGAVGSELVRNEKRQLTYTFESKWAPPAAFLQGIGPQWPTLTFDLSSSEMQRGYVDFCRVKNSSVESHQFRIWCKGEVYTTARPGYPASKVNEAEVAKWCSRVDRLGVKTILCLMDQSQLAYYESLPGGLLEYYRRAGFHVIHRPVKDHLDPPVPENILVACLSDFLVAQKPVLVHCSAGQDRTGAVVNYLQRADSIVSEGAAQS